MAYTKTITKKEGMFWGLLDLIKHGDLLPVGARITFYAGNLNEYFDGPENKHFNEDYQHLLKQIVEDEGEKIYVFKTKEKDRWKDRQADDR